MDFFEYIFRYRSEQNVKNKIKVGRGICGAFSNPLSLVAMSSTDVASLLQLSHAEDWFNKTLKSKNAA